MPKKVLILSSSPRRGGNSDMLCDEFMRGAMDSNNKVEKVFLRDKTIHPCLGCSVCSQYKKPCPQKDDAAEIIDKILRADIIVMATPVYFYAMSAQMKMLIDRCCGPYTEMRNKEFYFIATAAEDDPAIMERIVTNFKGFLDCLENPTIKGYVFCGGVWHVGEIKGNPVLQEAYEMGRKCNRLNHFCCL
ncbi:flavodoxin family protein [uncultured Parabacteroides sp.]|jgi:multimeric flavodoxin WrbA|uniref:flavodoxin family protein n=1 Tax=uncultured Parabacteroides sp. TaxID=512312 RepID=UPI0025D9FE85|nr:flavodoxin family protein [uncultured Parabacteroides sp.]